MPWTALGESRLRRLILLAAGAATALAAVALGWAAVLEPAAERWALCATAVGAVAAVLAALRSRRPPEQLRLTGDGMIWLRAGRDEPAAAAPEFLSPWLLVVRHGRTHLAIWRDQLPERQFGRLSACARWRVARTGRHAAGGGETAS